LMCGPKTQVANDLGISGWAANSASYLVLLVQRPTEHFRLERVSEDKSYLYYKYLRTIEKPCGRPFIPLLLRQTNHTAVRAR
jgi:hypothetical protein